MRPEVVLDARWCHIQILMSPIDSVASILYRWSVGNVRLSCTVEKLLDIFACALNFAVILPLKQTFVNLTSEMNPIAYCVSCRHAYLEPSSVLIRFFCAEIRGWTFKLEIPIDVPKTRDFWDNSPTGWDISMGHPKTHPWPKPRWLMCNMWDSSVRGRLCACRTKHRKKTPPVDNFTHMGNRDPPADHYELWPTWWSHRHNQLCTFLFWSVRGFLFCEVSKMAISYT